MKNLIPKIKYLFLGLVTIILFILIAPIYLQPHWLWRASLIFIGLIAFELCLIVNLLYLFRKFRSTENTGEIKGGAFIEIAFCAICFLGVLIFFIPTTVSDIYEGVLNRSYIVTQNITVTSTATIGSLPWFAEEDMIFDGSEYLMPLNLNLVRAEGTYQISYSPTSHIIYMALPESI